MKNEVKLLMEINPIVPEKDEKYLDYIQRIRQMREDRKYEFVYMERHHIILRSKGGRLTKENMIYLLAQEHFYAHKILAEEYPHDKSIAWAFWNMSHIKGKKSQKRYIPNAEEYFQARSHFVKNISRKNNSNYKKHLSEETKKKISETKKKNPRVYTEEEREQSRQRMMNSVYSFANKQPDKELMRKKVWDKNCLAVICINTGEIFKSAAEVEEKLGIGHSEISEVYKGKVTSAGKDQNGNKLYWKYADEALAKQYQSKPDIRKLKIYNVETKEIFESCSEVCKKYNIAAPTLSRHLTENTQFCQNREKTQKYKFRRYEEGDNNGSTSTI